MSAKSKSKSQPQKPAFLAPASAKAKKPAAKKKGPARYEAIGKQLAGKM